MTRIKFNHLFTAILLMVQLIPCYAQGILSDGQKILFVGNSMVGSEGGLHHHFRRTLKRMEHPVTVSTDWIAMYDKPTLSEMLTDALRKRIEEGDDNIIVVQSGAVNDLQSFADLIAKFNKKMVVFGVWPDNPFLDGNSFAGFSAETSRQYGQLKTFEMDRSVLVAPCGMAFQDLLAQRPDTQLRSDFLFTPGGSVQNDLGTIVNVAMLYAVMSGKSPVGLPVWDPFPKKLVGEIQARVYETYKKWKKNNLAITPYKDQRHRLQATKADVGQVPAWEPLLKNNSRIFYVGNSFIGTEGGLENHFPRLLTEIRSPYNVKTRSRIFWGQGLPRMFTNEVRDQIRQGEEDLIVVTSGQRAYLDSFYHEISAARKKMAVHMTWGRNPTLHKDGMGGYRESTREIVEASRAFEQETGIPVIPCGLIFYDLVANPPALKDISLRQDWVFMEEDIHQNHIGTMVNAAAHYAVLTGQSPVGLPMWDPYPEELVKAVQQRTWDIVKKWKKGEIVIR